MYKGLIKLKSTDQIIWVFFDNPKELDPVYKFWAFQDSDKGQQGEKWIRTDDISFFEFWRVK